MLLGRAELDTEIAVRQVTRRWLNWHGDAVVEHLAEQFCALEAALQS